MNASRRSSFWTSLPGILTGTAAVLTALTGIYLAMRGGPNERPPASKTPAATDASDSGLARNFVRQGSFRLDPPTEFVLSPQDLGLRDGFLTPSLMPHTELRPRTSMHPISSDWNFASRTPHQLRYISI
jgi:hypothetical protein